MKLRTDLRYYPFWWVTLLAASIMEATLGFILGFGMSNKLVLDSSRNTKEKAEQLREKIKPKQGKFGVVGIFVGVWVIVTSFIL